MGMDHMSVGLFTLQSVDVLTEGPPGQIHEVPIEDFAGSQLPGNVQLVAKIDVDISPFTPTPGRKTYEREKN